MICNVERDCEKEIKESRGIRFPVPIPPPMNNVLGDLFENSNSVSGSYSINQNPFQKKRRQQYHQASTRHATSPWLYFVLCDLVHCPAVGIMGAGLRFHPSVWHVHTNSSLLKISVLFSRHHCLPDNTFFKSSKRGSALIWRNGGRGERLPLPLCRLYPARWQCLPFSRNKHSLWFTSCYPTLSDTESLLF